MEAFEHLRRQLKKDTNYIVAFRKKLRVKIKI